MARSLISMYKKLMEKGKDLSILQSTAAIVHWDMETMMPPKAIELRSLQLAMLRRVEHKMSTDPEIGTLLQNIMRNGEYEKLNAVEKRNVYLMKKHYAEETSLPQKLATEIARQQATTVGTWKRAKAAKDFLMFKPDLAKMIELKKKAAEMLMEVKETATPYDALIDIYEPKMTTETISKVFSQLKKGLVSLIKKCETVPKQLETPILKREVPTNTQRKISKALADFIGYNIDSKEAGGRIDETEHPFTTGYYDDVRITTHYYKDNFASSLFSVLHEAGHAMYEQNLKREWIFQPVGTASSSGFHESQSRFVENIIGRSHEFWSYFLPKMKRLTGFFSNVDLDTFIHTINEVKPSKIRVEADEVTYCLHIIVRFNLEREIFADNITPEEVPEIWNQMYKDYLGVHIENDSEGAMQDTHWATGSYGYFPSYALGNIYSGQILAKIEKDSPGWKEQIAEGNFKDTKLWLIRNVYSVGNLYDPADLIKKITKQGLTVKPYLEYLKEKYSKLYGF